MSVWQNVDTLFQFAYHSCYVEIFKRRKEWFEKIPEMHMALWYIAANNLPSVSDATERLTYLTNNGETPYPFSFKKKFSAEDAYNFIPYKNIIKQIVYDCKMRPKRF